MAQDELSISGHAFEARIYAEDVPAGFLPAIGTLKRLHFPSSARVDTGVRQGDDISPHYDPMIAKLTVHAGDRAQALAHLTRALQAVEIGGTVTNIAFLAALSRHGGFAAGEVDTGLIARDLEPLTQQGAPCSKTQALAAVASLGLHEDAPDFAGMSLWGGVAQMASPDFGPDFGPDLGPDFGDGPVKMRVQTVSKGQFFVVVGDTVHEVGHSGESWSIDGSKISAQVWCDGTDGAVFWGNTYAFTVADPLQRASVNGPGDGMTRAPMPGLVRVVDVEPGARVKAGDRLLVLEAMKMEHALRASEDGVVAEVMTEAGAQVVAGAGLVRLESEDG